MSRIALQWLVLLLTACTPITAPTPAPSPTAAGATTASIGLLPASAPPFELLVSEWDTDFTRRTVEWNEIRSGGPPKEGIPAIDDPTFEDVDHASIWLTERDPILVFQHEGDVRGYPLAILIWHEIVNDTVGSLPVTVTFCPLCNASVVFARELQGETLDFGTTGLLRNSDLIMYDRQSESWWQQATGTAIVGQHAGAQLTFLAAQILSFADFAAMFPTSRVLARPDVPRSYGANPYTGYDTFSGKPFLFEGTLDTRLPATIRVVGVQIDDAVIAYPFSVLAEAGAINDMVGNTPVVVLHKAGTASALDTATIAEGRDVGSSAVFDPRVGNRILTFAATGDGDFEDLETGSRWNILGKATNGELAGEQLTQRVAFDHFWFAWAAFYPQTEIYQSE